MHLRGNAAEEPMDREKNMFIQQGRERTEDAFVLCRVLDHIHTHSHSEREVVCVRHAEFLSGVYLTHGRDYRDVFGGGDW